MRISQNPDFLGSVTIPAACKRKGLVKRWRTFLPHIPDAAQIQTFAQRYILKSHFSLLTFFLWNLPLLQPVLSSDQLHPCVQKEPGTCKPTDTGTSSGSVRGLPWTGCSSKMLGCWRESWNPNFLKRLIHLKSYVQLFPSGSGTNSTGTRGQCE